MYITFKIVFIGDSGAGKTAINYRFMERKFEENTAPTIGAIYNCRSFQLTKIKRSIKLQFWDTAGQERFRSIVPMYYRGAAAIILVFDITNRDSYLSIVNYWIKQIEDVVRFKVYLIGNKKDLSANRQVSTEEAENLANLNGYVYKEISAKCQNLEPVLADMTNDVFEQLCKSQTTVDKLHLFGVDVDRTKYNNTWCCY